MGLNRTIKAIRAALKGTKASVTLEWPDGRKATITEHVVGVRFPEKPEMIPEEDAKLYSFDVGYYEAATSEALKEFLNRPRQHANRDKIQGVKVDIPWKPKDDSAS